jgi:predicted HTH transcriptional regulator
VRTMPTIAAVNTQDDNKMIPKPFEAIAEADLLALISNAVSEGRTIDYKRELPGNSDGEKKEFLADVSSFANTSGGDLIFGMDEVEGLPTQLTGFQSANADIEIQRLDSILAFGIDPRIRYSAKIIQGGVRSLFIRVERSWIGPHRVIFKGHDRFYGRNSAGKYSLDVNQLRSAFTFSSTVTERIRAFRVDRIISLSNNDTPIPFRHRPQDCPALLSD